MATNQNACVVDLPVEEESLATGRSSEHDSQFDCTIGHIEDIIMEDEFQSLQQDFLEKYYLEFEDTEENKFIYTDIHNEYISLVEKFLLDQLNQRMPDFSMEAFQRQLVARKDELDGEVFEILLTFSDFMAFKEMFIDYRAEKEGKTVDLSEGLTVRSLAAKGSGKDAEEEPMMISPRQETTHHLDIGSGEPMMESPRT